MCTFFSAYRTAEAVTPSSGQSIAPLQMPCDVWPQLVLSEPTDAEREDARLARERVLKLEGHQFKVGRKDIDWSCGHHTHQEWKATLLTVSLRLPDLPDSARWQRRAVEVLNVEMMRQVLPDGAQHQRNPNYPQWMIRLFESQWRLARVRPDLGLRISTDTIARMHDYAIACNRPNGTVNSMHDCHGEWEGQHANPAMTAR